MRRILLWAVMAVTLLAFGCNNEPEPEEIKLDVPVGLSVTSITSTSITIGWESVDNADRYEWRCKSADGFTSGESKQCSATIDGLEPATEYQVAVRARLGESIVGAMSAYVTVTTAADGGEEGGDDPEDPSDPENPEEPVNPPVVGSVPLDGLIGYGANTTGGEGGQVYHFNSGTAFRDWLKLREKNKSTEPAVVWLSGTFVASDGRDSGSPWFDIKRTSNLTIYGTDSFRMDKVGFFLNEANNIIIRNIYIVQPKADNGADGISMQESQNVWVDHCTFESVNQEKDYEDGSCDVTHETNGVTISWCRYIKSQKSTLVGHSNNATADEKITITMHHNWFEGSSSRHPRVRFGRAHVFNNFYDNVTTYGVGSAYGAKVLVENNAFDGVRLPTDICTFPAKQSGSSWVSNLTGDVAGYLYELGNIYTNIPANASDPYPFTNVEWVSYNGERLATPLTYADFKPSYDYVVDAAEEVATIVKSGAGVGRLSGYAEAPVAADNGGMSTEGGGSEGDSDEGGSDEGGSEAVGSAVGGGWSLTSVNGAEAVATVDANGKLTLTALGKFESSAQKFGYVWRKVSGDFEAVVAIESYTSPKDGNQSAATLMICADPSASGTAMLYATSGVTLSEYYSHYRFTSGGNSGKKSGGARTDSGSVKLKLVRTGDSVEAYYSADGGSSYTQIKSDSFESALPAEVYVGLAVSSGSNSDAATATFGEVTIGGVGYGYKD